MILSHKKRPAHNDVNRSIVLHQYKHAPKLKSRAIQWHDSLAFLNFPKTAQSLMPSLGAVGLRQIAPFLKEDARKA